MDATEPCKLRLGCCVARTGEPGREGQAYELQVRQANGLKRPVHLAKIARRDSPEYKAGRILRRSKRDGVEHAADRLWLHFHAPIVKRCNRFVNMFIKGSMVERWSQNRVAHEED